MDPATIAAIIGGGVSLATTAGTAATTATANRRAYKWSKKMFDYQNEYNMQNYSPAAMMERYRQAGINPFAVAGTSSGSNSLVGSMSADYQNPLPPGSLDSIARTAFDLYYRHQQQKNANESTQSNISLQDSMRNKNIAETAKTNYYINNIAPHDATLRANQAEASKYESSIAKLNMQKLFNDVSLFSMQKEKYQLGLDLLKIEKEYADEYYKYRNQSVKHDSIIKGHEASIRGLDLKNYQQFGIRPSDPYYTRIILNVLDKLEKGEPLFNINFKPFNRKR